MVSDIVAMATTIQVSEQLIDTLKQRKLYGKESYEEVIWDVLEDSMELNEETKKEIEFARVEIKAGKFYTHEQVKKKLGL
jgi:predicted transcriptional regulator